MRESVKNVTFPWSWHHQRLMRQFRRDMTVEQCTMHEKRKPAWDGSLINRRRILSYGLAGMAGLAGGFWPLSALGETHLMHDAKTGGSSFDTLEYHTIEGSFHYSSLTIHKNYMGEYICHDNIYDMEKNPGHSSGKLPDILVKDIESNINAFTIVSEQKIDNPLHMYFSLFSITVDNTTLVQPEPDLQHDDMLPQYGKIADAFMECIEYLKHNGDRFFLETQCALEIDDNKHALFTFQVQNKGTIPGKITNFLEQHEYASTYHTEKGPGPLFTRSDCTVINANFDVERPELDLLPNVPLVVTVRTNSAIPPGEWAFTLGLAVIQELPADGGEARSYTFRQDLAIAAITEEPHGG